MRTKHYFFLGGILALLGGAVARLRPALVRSAKVTALTLDTPPTASVALRYSSGSVPISLIVDVYDQGGNGGSATIPGDRLFLEVPIIGALGGGYRLTTTATYRLLGRPWTSVREFTGQVAAMPIGPPPSRP
jgi:hypothetical protein